MDIPELLGTDFVGTVSTESRDAEAFDTQAPGSCTVFHLSVWVTAKQCSEPVGVPS